MSYNAMASDYEYTLVPNRFGRPARDLIKRVPFNGQRILDVGTGTGVALDVCGDRFKQAVGIDPSIEMLRRAAKKGSRVLVAGGLPHLPFKDDLFDATVASFVLSHVKSVEDALREVKRILRRGGIAAVSSWGRVDNEYRDLWIMTIADFVDTDAVWEETRRLVPNEAHLEDPERLRLALLRAQFDNVHVSSVHYEVVETPSQFIRARSLLLSSQIIRKRIGRQRWRELTEAVRGRLPRKTGEKLVYRLPVHMAVGEKGPALEVFG